MARSVKDLITDLEYFENEVIRLRSLLIAVGLDPDQPLREQIAGEIQLQDGETLYVPRKIGDIMMAFLDNPEDFEMSSRKLS